MTQSISFFDNPLVESINELLYTFNEATLIDISDAQGRILDVNEHFCKLSGFSREELIGQDHRILNSGRHEKAFFKNLWTTVLKGDIWRAEVCDKTKQGNVIWLDTTIVPLKNQEGKVYRFITVRSDITARVNAEAENQRLYQQIDALFASTHDIIWKWDQRKDTLVFSNALTSALGYKKLHYTKPREWFMEKIHPGDHQPFILLLNAHSHRKINKSRKDIRLLDANGNYRYFTMSIMPLFDEQGKLMEYLATMHDVTERRNREKEMMKVIIQAQDEERRYVGMELHDNVVQMLALAKLYLNDFVDTKNFAGSPHLTMMEQMINNAMQELRKLSHQLAPSVDQQQTLQDSIQQLVQKIPQQQSVKVKFQYRCAATAPVNPEVSTHLYRIVQEQLNNIFKHASATEVTIVCKTQGNKLVLLIADNGKGFDPHAHHTGIGLENMKRRVELTKGKMQIVSAPGKGCQLYISVPIA